MKLKDMLDEELNYSEFKSLKDNFIKSATELANFYERSSKRFEKNKQDKKVVRGEMVKAEIFREMAKYTKKLIP